MSNDYRMERIQRLLDELRYEVERGMMEGEVDESLGLVFFVPISKSLPNGVVRCEFRTRPIPRHMMGFGGSAATESYYWEVAAMTLPEELEYDLETLSEHWPQAEMRIRAELLRLARENAELHKSAMGGYEDGWHALRNERDALRTELAKLKARIAEAPVVTVRRQIDTSGDGDTGKLPPCDDLLARNGLKESADAVRQCRTEILALVRRAEREAKG